MHEGEVCTISWAHAVLKALGLWVLRQERVGDFVLQSLDGEGLKSKFRGVTWQPLWRALDCKSHA